MNIQKYISLIAVLAIPVFAETNQQGPQNGGVGRGMMNRVQAPVIVGTVTAVNGNTLTVNGKQGFNNATAATAFTVNATNAKITKNNTAGTIASIAVGDIISVQGTISGTNVAAKTIRDGVPQMQPAIQGNGQPVVAGAVAVINGNIITITNKSNVTYTIDATNAKFAVSGVVSPTISNVTVGDNVVVQGAVNGNSVTASSVIDQKAKISENQNNSGNDQGASHGFMGGMMNGITNFFKHMFGF